MAASPVPATGVGWSTAIPDIGQPHGNDYNEIQETKLAVSLRSNKEHVAYGADTAGGEHKPGSALSYFGDFSVSAAGDALPTRRPDAAAPWTSGGTALSAADYGRLAYDSDAVFGGILYQYTASGWVALGYVSILGDQTIAGVKTFQSLPKVLAAEADWGAESTDNPDDVGNRVPTDDTELTPKKYVDDEDIAMVSACSVHYDGTNIVTTTAPPSSFTDLDLPELSSNLKTLFDNTRVLVRLRIVAVGGESRVQFRTNGVTQSVGISDYLDADSGVTGPVIGVGRFAEVSVLSDANGVIEWSRGTSYGTVTVTLLTYQKVV